MRKHMTALHWILAAVAFALLAGHAKVSFVDSSLGSGLSRNFLVMLIG